MPNYRKIKEILEAKPTMEGAGVRLKRAFGHGQAPRLDPFLLLDDFHSENPDDYMAGFPWHPHRGIETVTYILHGRVEHGDSLGNKGSIGPGDIQWMSAGSGIIHQEMPQEQPGGILWGFQLWVNLPAGKKMSRPRYQGILAADIPHYKEKNGTVVKVICGNWEGVRGPVKEIAADPSYFDVTLPPETVLEYSAGKNYTVLAYVLYGGGFFEPGRKKPVEPERAVVYGPGQTARIESGKKELRFLLISGRPLREPVAWYGPIVMNTQEELQKAFEEYKKGTFIKKR